MSDQLLHFLVRYDKEHGTTEVRAFQDEAEAFAAYLLAERDPEVRKPKATVEVVLIGAESRATVEATYPHYFASGTRSERLRQTVDQLVG